MQVNHSPRVQVSIPGLSLSLCEVSPFLPSFSVLPPSLLSFLPQSKDMHIMLIGSESPVGVSVCVHKISCYG